MVTAGYSPSVRLFEAAACGVPVISDPWPGLETIFAPGREILVARSAADVLRTLGSVGVEEGRRIGARARRTALACHTALHRAEQLEGHLAAVRDRARSSGGG
jgi:spore maturation protein CgeB